MSEKTLSVFVDESGDFGHHAPHSPYYLVAMILHSQDTDISENISAFETHMSNLGYSQHAVHTGPLIRRESTYANDLTETRKRLFNALFNFVRRLNIHYVCAKIKKCECSDTLSMTSRLSREISSILHSNESFWNSFNKVIIYYDNGQIELTKILTYAQWNCSPKNPFPIPFRIPRWNSSETFETFRKIISSISEKNIYDVFI